MLSQTTVSRANVSAVIISTVENMFDGLCNDEQVDFGDLGKFRLQVTSKGADTAEKFTATNITGVNIQFVSGEDLKNIFASMEFVPLPTRTAMKTVVKAQKAGQTPVDISGKCGSDNGSDGGNTGGSDPDEGQEENPLG